MHEEAELGVCSHFNYKEGSKTTDHSFNHRLHSLRAVLEHYQERNESSGYQQSDETENFEHIQEFEDFEKIYVFSRDGDIKELPGVRPYLILPTMYILKSATNAMPHGSTSVTSL